MSIIIIILFLYNNIQNDSEAAPGPNLPPNQELQELLKHQREVTWIIRRVGEELPQVLVGRPT